MVAKLALILLVGVVVVAARDLSQYRPITPQVRPQVPSFQRPQVQPPRRVGREAQHSTRPAVRPNTPQVDPQPQVDPRPQVSPVPQPGKVGFQTLPARIDGQTRPATRPGHTRPGARVERSAQLPPHHQLTRPVPRPRPHSG